MIDLLMLIGVPASVIWAYGMTVRRMLRRYTPKPVAAEPVETVQVAAQPIAARVGYNETTSVWPSYAMYAIDWQTPNAHTQLLINRTQTAIAAGMGRSGQLLHDLNTLAAANAAPPATPPPPPTPPMLSRNGRPIPADDSVLLPDGSTAPAQEYELLLRQYRYDFDRALAEWKSRVKEAL